jgi:23S rRNA pseudouridine1911/1915/1917 synthase
LNRDPSDRRRSKCFETEEEGKLAISHYKTLENFYFASLVQCELETGRTHQIRAHFASIKHPLFSDELYGGLEIRKGSALPKFKPFIENCFTIMPRQALHAKELGFIHPTTGEKMFFSSELPEDFSTVLNKIRKYTQASPAMETDDE